MTRDSAPHPSPLPEGGGISPSIFREYDIRGIVGPEITPEAAATIARAYAAYLRSLIPDPRSLIPVVVGRDNRESSPVLRDAVVDALVASGCSVTDIGTVITPIFYFARVHWSIDGGVMITASHNPPEFNGFKLAHGFATLYGDQIQEIRRLASMRPPDSSHESRVTSHQELVNRDIVPAYLAMLRDKLAPGPRRLKVVVDCGNGTAGFVAPQALEQLGCEIVPLYCDPDPTFPHHHPDPVDPHNLTDLIATVRLSGADLGIAFDGDGDRIGVVDERGTILWGDTLMIVFWREILPKYPGTVGIVEVKCSQALYDEIARLGGRPMFYRTGHSLIKAKMRELGAVFTGEMSGHMFFADEYFGYDDAVYAAGRLLRILSHTDRPLSALTADIPRYYATPETRVECADTAKFAVVDRVAAQFKQSHEVIDVDGARILFDDGWGLIRASNTQPALVLRAESTTPEGLARIKDRLAHALAQFPAVGPLSW